MDDPHSQCAVIYAYYGTYTAIYFREFCEHECVIVCLSHIVHILVYLCLEAQSAVALLVASKRLVRFFLC